MLHPLTPPKVCEDQIEIRKKRDEETREESKHKKREEKFPNTCMLDEQKEGESSAFYLKVIRKEIIFPKKVFKESSHI